MSAVVTKPPIERRSDARRIRSMCTTVEYGNRLVTRTPALEPEDVQWFTDRGFTEVQSLIVLQRDCRPDVVSDEHITMYTWRKLSSHRLVTLRESLLAIDVAGFAPPWNLSPDAFARACAATSEHVVLVENASHASVGGFSIVGRSATTAYLQRLAVHPERRRQGVATRLVRQASAWAESRGAETLLVNTEPTNHPARQLYTSLGFTTLARQLSVLQRSLPESQ